MKPPQWSYPRRPAASKWRVFSSLGYTPSTGQQAFHLSEARVKVLIAGSRFGKSLAAAKDVLDLILTPDTRGWIVGPTYALADKEFRYLHDDLIVHLGFEPKRKQLATGKGGPSYLRFNWGSEIATRSADRPEGLLGEEVDWLILSEAAQIKEEILTRYLRARLASRRGRLIIPTTPSGVNWVRDAYRRGQDANDADWQSWRFASADNPHLAPDEIEWARRTLPADDFAEQFEGKFMPRRGLVFRDFDTQRHTTSQLPRGWEDWPLYRAIDFGYEHPFVCLWAVRDPEGGWWIIDELHERHLLMEDAAQTIRRRYPSRPIAATVADHDAHGRATLARHGVPTRRAKKNVQEGLAALRRVMQPHGQDAQPQLRIHTRCRNLIRELEEYAYAEDGSEQPQKFADDAVDALRYLVCTLDPRRLDTPAWLDKPSPLESLWRDAMPTQ